MNSQTTPTGSSCCAPAAPVVPGLRQTVAEKWRRIDKPLLLIAMLAIGIAAIRPAQLPATLSFTAEALLSIAPWLALSVLLAAYARASGADTLIARAFTGSPVRMIVMASLFGALSPFCSCGVVPVIAGLLAAGVPLAPVMAFWMSSPLMDPEMFILTAASLGMEFALVKAVAAVGIGLLSGTITHLAVTRGWLQGGLRAMPASCCSAKSGPPAAHWNVWSEPARRTALIGGAASNGWFLLRWMTIAFMLESLMVVYLPADKVVGFLGQSAAAIPLAILIGIPSYLNGYAALPLTRGLIDIGMNPAVALAFLISGGITSIPAATAVWALVKPRVFAFYVGLAVAGSLTAAYAYGALLALR